MQREFRIGEKLVCEELMKVLCRLGGRERGCVLCKYVRVIG